MRKIHLIAAAGAILAAASLASTGAHAASVADFYKGKKISLYIGYGAGGSYNLYARMVARHIGKHIPGNPKLIPRNSPGAGSIKLANNLYNTLPQDGTAIGTIGDVLYLKEILGTKGIKFKANKFNWIGRAVNSGPLLVVWHTAAAKNLEEAKKKTITVGVPGRGSATTLFLTVLNNMVGTKFKLISGYRGSADIRLALERGEVDATASVLWSHFKITNKDWLDQKKVRIFYQMANKRHPDLPNVPLVMDFAKTEKQKRLMTLFTSYTTVGRSYLAPPNVPKARVKALRAAFTAMFKDPAFLKEASKRKTNLNYMSGKDLQKVILAAFALPEDLKNEARTMVEIKVQKRKSKRVKSKKKKK